MKISKLAIFVIILLTLCSSLYFQLINTTYIQLHRVGSSDNFPAINDYLQSNFGPASGDDYPIYWSDKKIVTDEIVHWHIIEEGKEFWFLIKDDRHCLKLNGNLSRCPFYKYNPLKRGLWTSYQRMIEVKSEQENIFGFVDNKWIAFNDGSSKEFDLSEILKNIFKQDYILDALLLEQVSTAQYDLNDNGRPEIFLHLENSFLCGTSGCEEAILHKDAADKDWQNIASNRGVENGVYILPEKINGYHIFMNANYVWWWSKKTQNYKDICLQGCNNK